MKLLPAILTSLVLLTPAMAEDGWISLFDGKSLDGWKSNEEVPGVFTVEDGAIKVKGGRAHLFYMGSDGKASFTNFILKAKVKTTTGGNSGLYFHTKFQEKDWPKKGFECQVNSTHKDPRKTGSLYAVKDVMDNAPSKDDEWFDYEIKVEGKKVEIKVNGTVVTEWTQPDDWKAPDNMPGRSIDSGTFCLQGHDPDSVSYFKDFMVKPLE